MECLACGVAIPGMGPSLIAVELGNAVASKVKENQAHIIWGYPVNAVVTVLAIAAQPILGVIAAIALAVFKLLACCSQNMELQKEADELFQLVQSGFTARSQLTVRIFNPSFVMDSLLRVSCLENYPEITLSKNFAAAPAILAARLGKFCDRYIRANAAHGVWAYPLNGLVTILAVAVQPIVTLIGIITAAIFKLISCCSETYDERANDVFQAAIAGVTARPELLVRIINPSYHLDEKLHVEESKE